MTEQATQAITPVLLLILDGFGYREDADFNAVAHAQKPNWDRLWGKYPHTLINTSELLVGLPKGQMGNSEVGHLNIGAGRVVYQDLTKVDLAIEDGSFERNPALVQAVETAKNNGGALHIMGLLSAGGVHSHEAHIHAMLAMAAHAGLKKIFLHAFLDGRDTPPRSAATSLQALQEQCSRLGAGRIATICGRYFAMDRDNRWERVQLAYDLLAQGKAPFAAADAITGLFAGYARAENDEFVQATVIGDAVAMQDGDVAVFMNFRADRAREITRALTDGQFTGFNRSRFPKLANFTTLSSYGEDFHLPCAYTADTIHNGLGEYVSSLGLKQLRIAETEKYAHVTYFMSGGREQPYPGEDRILVPSPKVATYDLKPEMSAFEVTDKLEAAIRSKQYQAILCNYANGDMVGHSGDMEAAVKAVEALDTCVGRVVEAMLECGGEVLITADHGNAEQMLDRTTNQPHTAHTLNLVPFLYIGRKAAIAPEGEGALRDVAPTLLAMMGLPQPPEMTGKSLIRIL
ncbi:MAG: 2,3-bisphosphoglycerate-independent phosphoglycerate mutase [Gammaproteobacteria bacterium]|nr:2,3-bisphosphoglycerate-independent phosphoglycerate mutase [Gammaproteobacteria bacterium]MBU1777084.1 2,3-bisphosphoglycerate-independent phosphoglycerate mutase [Gammaproteobacteria bacterium]MBU1968387.1 2,3-bisphosphoglycerate-independent phosphoglycerate mutase [Gammaproteobacteria bacterium]